MGFSASRALAQGDEGLGEEEFRENSIVGRDLAFRFRYETQFSEDDGDLIDQSPDYARFPATINSAEAKLFQSSGASYSGTYSLWDNDQGLDSSRWSWKARLPITTTDFTDFTDVPPHISLAYRYQEGDASNLAWQAWQVGYDTYPTKTVYLSLQYRYSVLGGETSGHQVTEYMTWTHGKTLRIGEQVALSKTEGGEGVTPWYARLFTTVFLIEKWTSVRLEARHYQSDDDYSYEDYKTYLYQKIGRHSLLRLDYRYFLDRDGLDSNAVGLKLKHYLTPRFSVHVGYRYYEHSEGLTFDTYYAGLSLLL